MIVAPDFLRTIHEIFSITKISRRLPDNVLKPPGADRVATKFEILVPHQVKKNQGTHSFQLLSLTQLAHKSPTAISVIRCVGFTAIVPVFTECFFPVKKHEPVSQLWFRSGQHSTELK